MTPTERELLKDRIQSRLDHAMEHKQRLSIEDIARALNADNHLTEVRDLAIKLGVENDPYFAVLK